jgi:hypothetical protein
MSRFAFATAGLNLGSLFFLIFPSSFPLTLTDSNLINKDSVLIRNKPTLALRHTRTTCERDMRGKHGDKHMHMSYGKNQRIM